MLQKRDMKKSQSEVGLDVESGKQANNNEELITDNMTHLHSAKTDEQHEEKTP